jgi:hypothetical protein
MPPLGKCLRTTGATMVIQIGGKHKNTNKTQLLASNYGANQSLIVSDNINSEMDPLLSSSSSMRQAV